MELISEMPYHGVVNPSLRPTHSHLDTPPPLIKAKSWAFLNFALLPHSVLSQTPHDACAQIRQSSVSSQQGD